MHPGPLSSASINFSLLVQGEVQVGYLGQGWEYSGGAKTQGFHDGHICTGHAGGCQPCGSLKQPVLTVVFSPSADKLTEEEFIEGTLANKEILRLIQFEPQKVKERLKEKNP